MTSTWAQKAKLTMNLLAFFSVKFVKFGRLVVIIFILVGARSHGEGKTSFFAVVKDKHFKFVSKTLRKLPLQTLLLSCLKFVSRWMRCAVNILEYFTERN